MLLPRLGRRIVHAQSVSRLLYLSLSLIFLALSGKPLAAGENRVYGTVSIIDARGNSIKDRSNVVIFIDGLSAPTPELRRVQPIPRVSHKNRAFSPRVLPVIKGGQVDFFNDDSIYHNVFSLSRANPFDLGIYPEGTSKIVTFDTTGLVKLHCNIHPGMVSNILVLNNPYYAVTGKSGDFSIDNLPVGSFTLRTWHELGDEQRYALEIRANSEIRQDLQLRVTKRIRQHKNKFGRDYKSKY